MLNVSLVKSPQFYKEESRLTTLQHPDKKHKIVKFIGFQTIKFWLIYVDISLLLLTICWFFYFTNRENYLRKLIW